MCAFAPNFAHFIDSAHMLLTAIACKKQGLAFAAVHGQYFLGSMQRMSRLSVPCFAKSEERHLGMDRVEAGRREIRMLFECIGI